MWKFLLIATIVTGGMFLLMMFIARSTQYKGLAEDRGPPVDE